MKDVLRDGDTLSRMGGDEFVAVLVDLNRENPLAPFTAIKQKLVSRFGDGLGAGF